MELLAFSGYARSGKDAAAAALVEYGWRRVAFADTVRDFLYALNPQVSRYGVRVQEVINRHGWDGYKESPYGIEIRELLQRLGVDCGRKIISEDIWVDAALKDLDVRAKYAITDCRFVNEADGIRDRGGKIYRIIRPGVGPANGHMSETALDDYDFDGVIINDSTLEAFNKSVQALAFDGLQLTKIY